MGEVYSKSLHIKDNKRNNDPKDSYYSQIKKINKTHCTSKIRLLNSSLFTQVSYLKIKYNTLV